MNNIAHLLDNIFHPVKALVVFSTPQTGQYYIESYDMDASGQPINAHPLSVNEGNALSAVLCSEQARQFFSSKGLIPENVLFIDPGTSGCAIWHTPEMEHDVLFGDDLPIENGKAHLPQMIWKASRSKLEVHAILTKGRPTLDTPLYYAPFFNMEPDGKVCMGNVNIEIEPGCALEDFIGKWQKYFFHSTFSHLLTGVSPVKINVVELWQNLVGKNKRFPAGTLKKNGKTLKDLIS